MATYNKNEMLPQRKEALEKWAKCLQHLIAPDQPIKKDSNSESKILHDEDKLCII